MVGMPLPVYVWYFVVFLTVSFYFRRLMILEDQLKQAYDELGTKEIHVNGQ